MDLLNEVKEEKSTVCGKLFQTYAWHWPRVLTMLNVKPAV